MNFERSRKMVLSTSSQQPVRFRERRPPWWWARYSMELLLEGEKVGKIRVDWQDSKKTPPAASTVAAATTREAATTTTKT